MIGVGDPHGGDSLDAPGGVIVVEAFVENVPGVIQGLLSEEREGAKQQQQPHGVQNTWKSRLDTIEKAKTAANGRRRNANEKL
jgi:hypothetical protein